jgi:hypothetical protein
MLTESGIKRCSQNQRQKATKLDDTLWRKPSITDGPSETTSKWPGNLADSAAGLPMYVSKEVEPKISTKLQKEITRFTSDY